MQEGGPLVVRSMADPSYLAGGGIDPGRYGAGTFTSQDIEPTLEAYENIFGPSARDIKQDLQRFKRHGRWHLPDILKGPNQYLTDRIDGLITDATVSPFTSRILPYKYITNVDGKIKWNVWSFDEGLASRVPYESAARTLTQTKRNFAGYTIRQGMAIVLEHNFMMTEPGRENFRNQLRQLVGSIQLTNDLDVHVALVLAPSYEKHMRERYMVQDRSPAQTCREFVDMFGFVQKNQNALDILIEESKATLRKWGSPMPDFLLCNSKLTFQLTMTPDATNYVTKGPEGAKRLRTGPDLPSYRGISIVHTRAFSLETGQLPRDLMRRRVRVAEYYRITPNADNHKRAFQFYNEERDTWATFTFAELLRHAFLQRGDDNVGADKAGHGTFAKIEQTLTAMRGHAHAEGPAVAPRLAGPFRGAAESNEWLQLMDFGKKLGVGEIPLRLAWDGEPIMRHLIYVPGADPLIIPSAVVSTDARINDLADYDKGVLTAYKDAHSQPRSTEEVNRVILLMEAVARYPRTFREMSGAITHYRFDVRAAAMPTEYIPMPHNAAAYSDACYDGYYIRLVAATAWQVGIGTDKATADGNHGAVMGGAFAQAQADAAGAPAKANMNLMYNRCDALKTRLQFRSYLRYGVPRSYMDDRGGRALDLARGLPHYGDGPRAGLSPFSHWLRDLGAVYHPNHFRSDRDTQGLSDWGDYIGYNLILTHETLRVLLSAAADHTFCEGTLLYDAITRVALNPAGEAALLKFLQDCMNHVALIPGGGTRIDLTRAKRADLLAALSQLDTRAAGGGPLPTGVNHAANFIWKWPYAQSSTEDVFAINPPGWRAGLQKAIPGLYLDLDVTDRVIAEMEAAVGELVGCPFVAPLVEKPRDAPTAVSVGRFLRMLAWRLWSDQSFPLERKYAKNGDWPNLGVIIENQLDTARMKIGDGFYADGAWPNNPRWADGAEVARDARLREATRHMELVVIRPNIEHHMLGIVMGQGGESLGSTFWGQTELSCYDDSMHGIWGMSYKYNERAIVINERNLVRLWDIAYDGYVGGKDDTPANWNDEDESKPCSIGSFRSATMDVSQPYRGPSMIVMAFDHAHAIRGGAPLATKYAEHFRHNWPSPIVYYDRGADGDKESLPADFDNVHVVPVQQFRVFNNSTYEPTYAKYKDKMPDFYELHKIRKNAGLAAVENEVSSDALAFQGTMRVLNAETGGLLQEINGSGHHGPDFIGVASLRAGKGYKINSQPTIQRLV